MIFFFQYEEESEHTSVLKTTVLKQISDFTEVTDVCLIQDINKDVKTVGHKVTP